MNQVNDTCVSRVPLFFGLTPEQQLDVAGYARPIRRKAGEIVQLPSARSQRLLVVHRGQVRIAQGSESGREKVLRVLGSGDFFGETGFLTGAPAEHLATAVTPIEICSFDHSDLQSLLNTYPAIGEQMLKSLALRLQETERSLTSVTTVDVAARLAAYLLELPATRRGDVTTVRLPVPKKTLASLLGTSPETLSRRLTALADDGVISVTGREIELLDIDALIERAS